MDKIGLPQIGICGDGAMKDVREMLKSHIIVDTIYTQPDDETGMCYADIEYPKREEELLLNIFTEDNSLLNKDGTHFDNNAEITDGLYLLNESVRVYTKEQTYIYTTLFDIYGFQNIPTDILTILTNGEDGNLVYILLDIASRGCLFIDNVLGGFGSPFVSSYAVSKWANANFAQLADTDALKERLDNLIKDAPEAYDTLKEIGDYIATHKSEYEALNALANKKVDKEAGKGLSSNDYTTAEKTKLASVQEGATKTVVDAEISEDSTNPVQGKAIAELQKQLTQALREIGSMARDVYSHDTKDLPLLCGQPSILFAHGTPQEAVVPVNWKQYDWNTDTGYDWNGQPSAMGQQYINIDATTGGRYIAVPNDNGSLSWKNF